MGSWGQRGAGRALRRHSFGGAGRTDESLSLGDNKDAVFISMNLCNRTVNVQCVPTVLGEAR